MEHTARCLNHSTPNKQQRVNARMLEVSSAHKKITNKTMNQASEGASSPKPVKSNSIQLESILTESSQNDA
eukprot:1255654-Amphidinium_carterae.1